MKSLFMTILMAAAFSACGHRASTESTADADSVSTDSTKVEAPVEEKPALVLDTISFERNDSMAEVSLSVQWPIEGNEELVTSVRQFICEVCNIKNNDFKGNKKDFKDERIYSLSGQFLGIGLENLENGIYIINNEKYLLK